MCLITPIEDFFAFYIKKASNDLESSYDKKWVFRTSLTFFILKIFFCLIWVFMELQEEKLDQLARKLTNDTNSRKETPGPMIDRDEGSSVFAPKANPRQGGSISTFAGMIPSLIACTLFCVFYVLSIILDGFCINLYAGMVWVILTLFSLTVWCRMAFGTNYKNRALCLLFFSIFSSSFFSKLIFTKKTYKLFFVFCAPFVFLWITNGFLAVFFKHSVLR